LSENGRPSKLRGIVRALSGGVPDTERTAERLASQSAALALEAETAVERAAELERVSQGAQDRVLQVREELDRERASAKLITEQAHERVASALARLQAIEASAAQSGIVASRRDGDGRRRGDLAEEEQRRLEQEVKDVEVALVEAEAVLSTALKAHVTVLEDADSARAAAVRARADADEAIAKARAAADQERAHAGAGVGLAARSAGNATDAPTAAGADLEASSNLDAFAETTAQERRAAAAAELAATELARTADEAREAMEMAKRRRPRLVLGAFPIVALVVSIGLAICSVTDALARASSTPSVWFLWLGIGVIVVPVIYRLCSADASVGERVAIVCLFGLALYAVKVMRDPFSFGMPDEFFHAFNAQQIAIHHHLFNANSGLPVSTRYPGLEGATSALMSLTGMSAFGAGLIVIGAARLVLMVALFVLFRKISGSARIAGLGAAIYAGNGNFLYFSAMFSYESLALPLFVVVLATIAVRADTVDRERRHWAFALVLMIAAVVVTHHLTSYLMDLVLVTLAVIPAVARKRTDSLHVWPFAAVSVALTTAWLAVVASVTVGYISPVVTAAFQETIQTIAGDAAPRAPFSAAAGGAATPVPERVLVIASLVILFVALPFGLVAVWRRHRRNPLALLLSLAALGFFGALLLRFSPSAWEIGNRMSETLFIGLGFIAAYAVVARLLPRARWWGPAIAAAASAVVVTGGAITGWPADVSLAAPVRIVADGHQIESESVALGRWARMNLPGAYFGAPQGDARTLLMYGDGRILSGSADDVDHIITSQTVTAGDLNQLYRRGVRYIVVDTRERGDDDAAAYSFSIHGPSGTFNRLYPSSIVSKFDNVPLARIYDSGNIVIFRLTPQ
jgi:hypothetical protein